MVTPIVSGTHSQQNLETPIASHKWPLIAINTIDTAPPTNCNIVCAGNGLKGMRWQRLKIVANRRSGAAVINTNYALAAGLQPTTNAIALEDIHSPYANIIVVRTQDKDKPWVKKLVAAYQSEEVRQFMKAQFKGAMVPSF